MESVRVCVRACALNLRVASEMPCDATLGEDQRVRFAARHRAESRVQQTLATSFRNPLPCNKREGESTKLELA